MVLLKFWLQLLLKSHVFVNKSVFLFWFTGDIGDMSGKSLNIQQLLRI